jgi:hypothetical protein
MSIDPKNEPQQTAARGHAKKCVSLACDGQ